MWIRVDWRGQNTSKIEFHPLLGIHADPHGFCIIPRGSTRKTRRSVKTSFDDISLNSWQIWSKVCSIWRDLQVNYVAMLVWALTSCNWSFMTSVDGLVGLLANLPIHRNSVAAVLLLCNPLGYSRTFICATHQACDLSCLHASSAF